MNIDISTQSQSDRDELQDIPASSVGQLDVEDSSVQPAFPGNASSTCFRRPAKTLRSKLELANACQLEIRPQTHIPGRRACKKLLE